MKEERLPAWNETLALTALQRVLVELGWEPVPGDERGTLFVDFGPPHVPISGAFAAIQIGSERIVFYLLFGSTVPSERRDEVARLVVRANWGLVIGNFEQDYEKGVVRFKSSLDFDGVELSEILIRNLIRAAMEAVEIYADSFDAVMAGKQTAAEAIDEVEAE